MTDNQPVFNDNKNLLIQHINHTLKVLTFYSCIFIAVMITSLYITVTYNISPTILIFLIPFWILPTRLYFYGMLKLPTLIYIKVLILKSTANIRWSINDSTHRFYPYKANISHIDSPVKILAIYIKEQVVTIKPFFPKKI